MPSARDVDLAMRGQRNADVVIGSIAGRQFGVVARRQLAATGIDRRAIDRRIARGVLRHVHRSVYAFGHTALTAQGRWMAAVLAGGPDAVLSHRSAAAHWCLLKSRYVDVTIARQRRAIQGVHLHRARLLYDETTTREGIRITTVPRTLLDLATVLRPSQLKRAINEAEVQRHTDVLSLPDLLIRHKGRAGTQMVRTVLAELQGGTGVTREGLEDHFADFLTQHRLPLPEFNAWLQINGVWIECDCVWRRQRVIAELDSRQYHATRAAFEDDRAVTARCRQPAGARSGSRGISCKMRARCSRTTCGRF